MKKTLLISGLVVSGLFLACQKSHDNLASSTDVKNQQVQQDEKTKGNLNTIQDKSSDQEAILIFNSLTSQEKADVWKMHLLESKNNLNLNDNQKDFIQQTIDFITPELYDHPEINETSPEMHQIEGQMKALFAFELRAQIFNDLDIVRSIQAGGGTSALDCNCSVISDWCGFGETGSNRSKCLMKKDCNIKGNCGTLWAWTCRGRCGIKMPN